MSPVHGRSGVPDYRPEYGDTPGWAVPTTAPHKTRAEINSRVAQAIMLDAALVQARRALREAQDHLERVSVAHEDAWSALDADETHEANMCVLAGMEVGNP